MYHLQLQCIIYSYNVSYTATMYHLQLQCIIYSYNVSSTATMYHLQLQCIIYSYNVSYYVLTSGFVVNQRTVCDLYITTIYLFSGKTIGFVLNQVRQRSEEGTSRVYRELNEKRF